MAQADESILDSRLKTMQGVTSLKKNFPSPTASLTYVLAIEQPLDHAHPEKGNFKQQVILKYTGFAKPVVMEIEGYYGGNMVMEAFVQSLEEMTGLKADITALNN